MPEHDRRGSKPGAPKPDVPWLKDRPDLHRTEDEAAQPGSTGQSGSGEAVKPPAPDPEKRGPDGPDQRVPGSERRGVLPPQPDAPSAQGNATKARRRPS